MKKMLLMMSLICGISMNINGALSETSASITTEVGTFIPYVSENKIQERVRFLANQMRQDYPGKRPIFVGVLFGCKPFMADLLANFSVPSESGSKFEPYDMAFIRIASYGNTTESSGNIKLVLPLTRSITDRDTIIVEDIIDTGLSMKYVYEMLLRENPRSLAIATFLRKEKAKDLDLPVKYVGLDISNEFVIGYGLDYADQYRNLRSIYQLVSDEKKRLREMLSKKG
jgi:hypoxanthine phosphoribosyltransferase